MSSPTVRSLDKLRKEGFIAEVVEKWNPHSKTRKDLFGFIDIVGVKQGSTLGIQATTKGNMSSRVKKITESNNLETVLEAGWEIEVWGWWKNNKNRWEVKIHSIKGELSEPRFED
jgi:hypothetical protein